MPTPVFNILSHKRLGVKSPVSGCFEEYRTTANRSFAELNPPNTLPQPNFYLLSNYPTPYQLNVNKAPTKYQLNDCQGLAAKTGQNRPEHPNCETAHTERKIIPVPFTAITVVAAAQAAL